MKRILSIIILIFIIISFNTVSMAADVSVTLNADKNKTECGTEIKVSIGVNNFTREGTQKAIEGKLEYDKQRLQYKSISWSNGWTGSISSDGTGLVASKSGQVGASENVAQITYVVKDNAEKGNAAVGIKNVVTSADGDEIAAGETKITVEVIEKTTTPSPSQETSKPQEPVQTPTQNKSEGSGQTVTPSNNDKKTVVKEIKSGNTKSGTIYPYTGLKSVGIIGLLLLSIILVVISYIKYNKYKKI